MSRKSATKPTRTSHFGCLRLQGELWGDDDLESLAQAPVVSLDTETTGLPWGSQIIGVSLAWKAAERICSLYLAFNDQLSLFGSGRNGALDQLLELIQGKTIAMHTQSFDIRHLFYNLNAPELLPERVVDVAVLAAMVGAQESRKLVALYTKYIADPPEIILSLKEERGNLARLPASEVQEYARWDAIATLELFYKLMRLAKVVPAYHTLYPRDIAFTQLVNRLMVRGLPVDRAFVEKRMASAESDKQAILKRLRAAQVYLNPDSHDQVLQYVKTHGNPYATSVDAESLAQMVGSIPFVDDIVAYRQLNKAIGSWYVDLLEMSRETGCLHAELKPFGTRSYRMAADDINVQAIPMKPRNGKNGQARAFGYLAGVFASPDPGEVLWQFDCKQAEVRLAGMLAGDSALAETFNAGIDPYKAQSLKIWNTEARRNDAKSATLAAIYEIGYNSFSMKNGVSVEEAKAVLNAFRSSFPDLRKASRADEAAAKRQGYIELFDGRRRFFTPDEELYKAFNQRVQGAVSELMQLLMLAFEDLWPGRLLLQIHDSLVARVPRDPVAVNAMKDRLELVANDILPEQLRRATKPSIPMLLDSETWEAK